MNTSMQKSLAILALGALGMTATSALADWNRGGYGHMQAYQQTKAYSQQIDARQDRQIQRIHAGMRAGKLTRAEFRELMQEQHQIRAMEQRFRSDGIIDAREFKRLDRALDVADRNIMAEKHDRQVRSAHGYNPWFN